MSGVQLKELWSRTQKYTGVRVTEQNMETVAEWCGGTVRVLATPPTGSTGNKVRGVFLPERKLTQSDSLIREIAGPGDWVLYQGEWPAFSVAQNTVVETLFLEATKGGYHNTIRRAAGMSPNPTVPRSDKVERIFKILKAVEASRGSMVHSKRDGEVLTGDDALGSIANSIAEMFE